MPNRFKDLLGVLNVKCARMRKHESFPRARVVVVSSDRERSFPERVHIVLVVRHRENPEVFEAPAIPVA